MLEEITDEEFSLIRLSHNKIETGTVLSITTSTDSRWCISFVGDDHKTEEWSEMLSGDYLRAFTYSRTTYFTVGDRLFKVTGLGHNCLGIKRYLAFIMEDQDD